MVYVRLLNALTDLNIPRKIDTLFVKFLPIDKCAEIEVLLRGRAN